MNNYTKRSPRIGIAEAFSRGGLLLYRLFGFKGRTAQASALENVGETGCDPTWNFIPRGIILYILPMFAVGSGIEVGMLDGTAWILPAIYAAIIPPICIFRRTLCLWGFQDVFGRDCFPLTVIAIHVGVWFHAYHLFPNRPLAAVLTFACCMSVYDSLLCFFRLINFYCFPNFVAPRYNRLYLAFIFLLYWTILGSAFSIAGWILGSDVTAAVLSAFVITFLAALAFTLFARLLLRRPEFEVARVAVIGGGWAGLLAAKWLNECGLQVVGFEKSDRLGGSLADNPNRDHHATSPKTSLHLSDFPMEPAIAEFPSDVELFAYFNRYKDKFGIDKLFRSGCLVEHIDKTDDKWHLRVLNNGGSQEEFEFDAVVVCTGNGRRGAASELKEKVLSDFAGNISMVGDEEALTPPMASERVLMVGRADAHSVQGIVQSGAEVWWSRQPIWFMPERIGHCVMEHLRGIEAGQILEKFYGAQYLAKAFIEPWIVRGYGGVGGHGITQWAPDLPLGHQACQQCQNSLSQVSDGSITPIGKITRASGRVIFCDDLDHGVEFDRVITFARRTPNWQFCRQPTKRLFKHVFSVEDPTLACVGHARPTQGSALCIMELQARWIAEVFAGRVTLPAKRQREITHDHDRKDCKTRFRDPSEHGELVDRHQYVHQLAGCIRAEINWLRLFWVSPKRFFNVLRTPWTSFKLTQQLYDRRKHAVIDEWIRAEIRPLNGWTCLLYSKMVMWTLLVLMIAIMPIGLLSLASWFYYCGTCGFLLLLMLRLLNFRIDVGDPQSTVRPSESTSRD